MLFRSTDVPEDGAQPTWFATVLEDEDGIARLRSRALPVALETLRPALLSMTPSEALDAVLEKAGMLERAASWPDANGPAWRCFGGAHSGTCDRPTAASHFGQQEERLARPCALLGGLAPYPERTLGHGAGESQAKSVPVVAFPHDPIAGADAAQMHAIQVALIAIAQQPQV